MIVFNNFDVDQNNDSSDDDQESQQQWFKKIKNAIREFTAKQIIENIYENQFDFEDVFQRNDKKEYEYMS